MAGQKLASVLDQCVTEIKAGRKTLDQCLAEHPEARAELEPLLRIATAIVPPTVTPDPARKAQARYAFTAALQREQRARWAFWAVGPAMVVRRLGTPAIAALLVVALVATGGSVAFASQEALPGHPLYGMKTALEQVQLVTASTPEAKAEVYLRIAAKRLAEVERAVERDNAAAAQAAADAHAQAIAQAEEHLALAEQRGRPVDAVLAQLEANLARQQETLRRASERAPEPAQAALARARERAERGLQRAKERAAQRGAGAPVAGASPSRPSATESRGRSPESTAQPTATTEARAAVTATVGAVQPLTPTVPAQEDVAAGLTRLAAQLDDVAREADLRGESYRSLRAKLAAIEEAIRRSQPRAALQQLGALRNELDALRRTGRLAETQYAALIRSIDWLQAALRDEVATPPAEPRGRDDARPGGQQQGLQPTPGRRQPEARPTPGDRPDPPGSSPGGTSEGRDRGRRSAPETPAASARPTPEATPPAASAPDDRGQRGREDAPRGRPSTGDRDNDDRGTERDRRAGGETDDDDRGHEQAGRRGDNAGNAAERGATPPGPGADSRGGSSSPGRGNQPPGPPGGGRRP